MSAQTRCCVVCSRSSPKTIFSCRYKVHQRNVEVLRTFFKRELDFGELCDRCYRLWYKHKRAKKEPTNNTTQNAKNTRKRKSITDIATPTSPAGIDPPKYTTNGCMTRIESSGSGPLQYPPFKKYKNSDEVEYNGLHMSSVQMEQMSGHSYFEHNEECIVEEPTIMSNDEQDESKLAQIRLQEQQDNEILEEISNTSQDEQQEERELSLLDAIKVITQAPRISKRKPTPLKSPLKLDPVYEHIVCTNHAHILLNKQNENEKNCVNNEQIEETVTA